jgi:hypothetical protein
MIYGAHYYYGRSFYDALPITGADVGGLSFFPPLDVGGKTYAMGVESLTFTGRIFAQDSEATTYEAVLKNPGGESYLVSVKIRDHALDPIASELDASREVEDLRMSGDPNFFGETVVDGFTAIVVSP